MDAATTDFNIGPVYMLLMGMSVEAALKAVLVAGNPDIIETQRVSKDLAVHDLKGLWNLAGLNGPRSRNHDSLLDCLESFVVAFGRYPVTKTKHDMGTMMGSSFHGELYFDQVDKLWDCLERHTKKIIPPLFDKNSLQDGDK